MAKVLLGVTGSVAAMHTPLLYEDLRRAGHDVKVVATGAALYFFDAAAIAGQGGRRNPDALILDEDEWPEHTGRSRYERGDPVLHIELRRWADALVIAPLDANTLAKLAGGLADNCLTCVWRAWDRARPAILAPAMNTLMWEHPVTARHLRQLAEDMIGPPPLAGAEELVAWLNSQGRSLRIAAPISKRLACDDVGVGAMAEREAIVQTVALVV